MAEELETKDITLMPYGEISQKIAAYNTSWGSRQINQPEKILTTNLPSYIPMAFPLKPGSPIDELLADLRDLVKEDEKDEYGILRPTMHALSLTILLIIEAYCRQHSNWPFGCVSTDSEGGIRIEWHSSKGEIRLVVPAAKDKKHYIYYEFGNAYDIEEEVNPGRLVWWLNRLI